MDNASEHPDAGADVQSDENLYKSLLCTLLWQRERT